VHSFAATTVKTAFPMPTREIEGNRAKPDAARAAVTENPWASHSPRRAMLALHFGDSRESFSRDVYFCCVGGL